MKFLIIYPDRTVKHEHVITEKEIDCSDSECCTIIDIKNKQVHCFGDEWKDIEVE